MKIELDVNDLAEQIKAGKSLTGKDGALSALVKQITDLHPSCHVKNNLNYVTFSLFI